MFVFKLAARLVNVCEVAPDCLDSVFVVKMLPGNVVTGDNFLDANMHLVRVCDARLHKLAARDLSLGQEVQVLHVAFLFRSL